MRLLAKLLKEVEKKYEELKGVLEDLVCVSVYVHVHVYTHNTYQTFTHG